MGMLDVPSGFCMGQFARYEISASLDSLDFKKEILPMKKY